MDNISEELIKKFFAGACSPEEAAAVAAWLRKHPDHPYLSREWELADSETALPGNTTQDMYDAIEAHIKKTITKRMPARWPLYAAACMAMLMIGAYGTWKLSQTGSSTSAPLAQSAAIEWMLRQNTQDTALNVSLPDNTVVTLWPGTTIRYTNAYGKNNRRDVFMEGEAFYEVAKDKTRPFTVHSRYVATTALGTVFRVTTDSSHGSVKVRLYEGSVLVIKQPVAGSSKADSCLLQPGQELAFDAPIAQGRLHNFLAVVPQKAIRSKLVAPVMPVAAASPASYMFNNQTLADVLDQLAAMHHVNIAYSEKAIGQIYFIGRIETNEPVDQILTDIALLNKLTVKKQNGGFVITRKKQ